MYGELRQVLLTYQEDIEDAMDEGPCREVLAGGEDIAALDRNLDRFDAAVDALARGDEQAFRVNEELSLLCRAPGTFTRPPGQCGVRRGA